jgi:hypothetical protein
MFAVPVTVLNMPENRISCLYPPRDALSPYSNTQGRWRATGFIAITLTGEHYGSLSPAL